MSTEYTGARTALGNYVHSTSLVDLISGLSFQGQEGITAAIIDLFYN